MQIALSRLAVGYLMLLISGTALSAGSSEYTGRWEVTTSYPGGSFVAGLDLTTEAGAYSGNSGYLVPDGYFYKYSGDLGKDGLHLRVLAPDAKTAIGDLILTVGKGGLSGKGAIHDIPVTLTARRPLQRPANSPTVHDFTPQVYYTTFSGGHPPALRIFPGDTVRTKTVDAGGSDEKGVQRTLAANPQTGPFYIEGAMIGDTIAVHFKRIRPNRDTAFQYRAALSPKVLPPGYQQQPTEGWSNLWKLDRVRGTATPIDPSDKLKNFTVQLIPMLGCVSVAPYSSQAIATGELGPFGGNLDYYRIREGTTLYLPVYQAGALLTIGDGHAAQADGEINGQGLETSMDVEFAIGLIKDQLIDQPWARDEDYVMVSGIGGSLSEAAQNATAGLSNWLKSYYDLNTSEVATFLAGSLHYDIAELVDAQLHVVAKVRNDALSQLPKPADPRSVFCQPGWGCLAN
jgi:amidase